MMKKILSFGLMVALCLLGCKKDNSTSDERAALQIDVSGLTANTSLSISVINSITNTSFYQVSNQFGNKSYYTPPIVTSGSNLTVIVTANLDDNKAGDGDGNVSFSYKGQNLGAHGGAIGKAGFTQQIHIP